MAEDLKDAGRVAYLEARIGELHETIGQLRGQLVERDVKLAAAQLDILERGKALDRAEASRQAWAEEAMRLDDLVREAVELLNDIIGYVPGFFQEKWRYPAQISSISERVSRPVCTVHPDGAAVDLCEDGAATGSPNQGGDR